MEDPKGSNSFIAVSALAKTPVVNSALNKAQTSLAKTIKPVVSKAAEVTAKLKATIGSKFSGVWCNNAKNAVDDVVEGVGKANNSSVSSSNVGEYGDVGGIMFMRKQDLRGI